MPKPKPRGPYRVRVGSDCAHFVKSCRWWPLSAGRRIKQSKEKPSGKELCNECEARERRGER